TAGQTGMLIAGATVAGTVGNSGTITATGTNTNTTVFSVGMGIFASSVGAIQNTKTITADVAGISIGTGTVAADVTNSQTGTIQVTKGVGILVTNVTPTFHGVGATTISGRVINQGTIAAKTGIQVIGSTIAGGIINTGNITGTRAAIDLS